MRYKLAKGLTGISVHFLCPKCNTKLNAKLQEAGNKDACPDCGAGFVVPGGKEKLERAKLALEAKQKAEQAKLEKAEAKRTAAVKAAEEAEVKKTEAPKAEVPKFAPAFTPPKPTSPLPQPTNHVPPPPKYRALEIVAIVYKCISALVFASWVLFAVVTLIGVVGMGASADENTLETFAAASFGGVFSLLLTFIPMAIMSAFLWATAEMIHLAIDIQNSVYHSAYVK